MEKAGLQLKIERNQERFTQIITTEITDERQFDTPPPPRAAVIGDDWISLQEPRDADRLLELGYWQLEPEGMAMHFLRLAWLAAHYELRAKHKPFDGDSAPSWDKQ